MISYPDLDRAIYWKNKNMEGKLEKFIMIEIRKMFSHLEIPDLRLFKNAFLE